MTGTYETAAGPWRGAGRRISLRLFGVLATILFAAFTSRAAIQFDVFLGNDGIITEAAWFPVICEIKNDGAAFTGIVEVSAGAYNQGQTRRLLVELPTGTLKRVYIPVFASGRGFNTWDVRLLDERGRVRAEQTGVKARKQTPAAVPVVGSMPRTASGTVAVKPVLGGASEFQPVMARLLPGIFPDNPLVLEGVSTIYLNSERAAELSNPQAHALLAWMDSGGHLIVGVEQPGDINALPWLRGTLPCEITDLKQIARHSELQDWLRTPNWPRESGNSPRSTAARRNRRPNSSPPANDSRAANPFSDLKADNTFEAAEMQVATAKLRDGEVIVGTKEAPLVVSAQRGRGTVTVLLFSPEREPMAKWDNLPVFWAKLAGVPGDWYVQDVPMRQGGYSSDGIFGSMIETRQVHKLPLGWLLCLLLVYLVVIGPLDQFWLKRINKPMLTWITFPCYVVFFSVLIYIIGYKLRAGESEWNELNIVDVLPHGERADLRGRTYASVYSPANQRYELSGGERYATFRGEYAGAWGGGGTSAERASVMQSGDSFKAEAYVPVWTSQLFVSDWWQPANNLAPIISTVTATNDGWRVTIQNLTDHSLSNAMAVIEGRVSRLGVVAPKSTSSFSVTRGSGQSVDEFVTQCSSMFHMAVQSRRQSFGGSGHIENLPDASAAASFLSHVSGDEGGWTRFTSPPGLDLSREVTPENAIIMAWSDGYSPIKPMRQFTSRRTHENTFWRLVTPIQ